MSGNSEGVLWSSSLFVTAVGLWEFLALAKNDAIFPFFKSVTAAGNGTITGGAALSANRNAFFYFIFI